MSSLANLAAFQALWLALVLGAAHGWDLAAMALLVAWMSLHFRRSHHARSDWHWVAGLAALGFLMDTALAQAGLVRFAGRALHPGVAPWWMIGLWVNFALTLNHSMRWMGRRPLGAAVFGAAGGPLAYYGGARLGAATLAEPLWQPLLALALIWGVVVIVIARRLQPRPA